MSEILSPAQVAEIRARAEKATPDWRKDGMRIVAQTRGVIAVFPRPQDGGTFDCAYNLEFALHASEDVPALCDSYEEQARRIAELEAYTETMAREHISVFLEEYRADFVLKEPNRLIAQAAEIERLRRVCGEAYQLAGAVGAPVAALDNLSDAANGMPLRHESFLPIVDTDCHEIERLKAKLTEDYSEIKRVFRCKHPPDDGSDDPCDGEDCMLCWFANRDPAMQPAEQAKEQG